MPIVFLCTAMIDKAINRLMRDHAMPALSSQVSSDLLGGPADQKLQAHVVAQLRITREFEACIPLPAAFAQRLCTHRFVAITPNLGGLAVTLKLPADRTSRTSQSSGYRPHRMTRLAQPI